MLELPAPQVWAVVRDFNSYPMWVDGVEDSHIEEDLSGTTVGGIRNFAMGGFRTRQRLLAHSDLERFFTYESCGPVEIESDGSARTLSEGTLNSRRRRPLLRGVVGQLRMSASGCPVLGQLVGPVASSMAELTSQPP
ncbi:MAG: SRPBCC family protein [Solirubrobacterales bacterium]|nr:SRPBCC family protein [Solirubrobacterales bacterium]